VLLYANYAEKAGKQLLIKQELDEQESAKKVWLYSFLQEVKPGEVTKLMTNYLRRRGNSKSY
jgi:hypothetical protein